MKLVQTQGENVKEYMRRLRLEKAAYELKITNFPILEIAIEAGFLSHEAFSKAFKRVIGSTPNEFRKQFQKKKYLLKIITKRFQTVFQNLVFKLKQSLPFALPMFVT